MYWGYIGIMENKMETTVVYWGYIGIMEKKMETTTMRLGVLNIAFLCDYHHGEFVFATSAGEGIWKYSHMFAEGSHGVWVWQIPTRGPSCREGPEAEALPPGPRAREASTNRHSGTLRIEPVVDSSRGLISHYEHAIARLWLVTLLVSPLTSQF